MSKNRHSRMTVILPVSLIKVMFVDGMVVLVVDVLYITESR